MDDFHLVPSLKSVAVNCYNLFIVNVEKPKIAIVDDEKNVRLPLRKFLESEGFDVAEFSDGKEALDDLTESKNPPAVYILDIMMPVMDGIMFLQKYKAIFPEVPAIFLTSRDEEFDKILGLELGADDYLTKPFSMKELLARVKVLLRRYQKVSKEDEKLMEDDKNLLRSENLVLNTKSCVAKAKNAAGDSEEIPLTVTEFRLLENFMKNPDEVFTREQLIEIAYPEDIYLNDRAIDCHIKRLRKKIGTEGIETVYGLGYKFLG